MSRENHSDQQAGQTDGGILNSHKSGGTTVTGPRGRKRIFQWLPNQAKLSHTVCGTCTYAAGHPVKRHMVISTKFQIAGGDGAGLAGGWEADSEAQSRYLLALLLCACACVCTCVSYGSEFYNKTIKHSLEKISGEMFSRNETGQPPRGGG